MLLFVLLAALPVRPFTTHGGQSIYPNEIITDSFEIIDASLDKKKVVAFKHVYHLAPYPSAAAQEGEYDGGIKPPELIACNYPGLDKLPTSGVTFGIYDLASDKLQHAFTLYASTFGKCTEERTAEITREKYKTAMESYGLDTESRLPLLELPAAKNGEQSFALTSKVKNIAFKAQNVREPKDMCGKGPMITMSRVEKAGKLVWARCQQDVIRATAGGSFVYPYALVIGKKAVLVELFRHATHESGARDKELWSFSKVLSLD